MRFKNILDIRFYRTKQVDVKIANYSQLVLFRHYSCQEVPKLTSDVITVFGGSVTAHSSRKRTEPQKRCLQTRTRCFLSHLTNSSKKPQKKLMLNKRRKLNVCEANRFFFYAQLMLSTVKLQTLS